MATGDRICPTCGQWQQNCECWLGKIRRGQPVGDFPLFEWGGFDWVKPQTLTDSCQPGAYYTSTTITTSKPRKRRRHWQVVY